MAKNKKTKINLEISLSYDIDFLNSQYRVLLIQSKFVLPDNTLSIEKIEKEIKVIKAKLNMKFRALQKLQMEEI